MWAGGHGQGDAQSEAVLPTWVLGTAQRGTRFSRVPAAKPLTLASWLPSAHRAQTLGGGRGMPTGPTAWGQGARAVAHGFVSLPHPCQPVSLTLWCHQAMGGLCLGG